MVYRNIVFEKVNEIGIITLNRPAANNTVDARLAGELGDICTGINQAEEIKVVVITGAGKKAFCAGTDPDEISSVAGRELGNSLLTVAAPVADLRVPVIAAINGDALGQGLELALACDIRIAVETASFALPQLALGLIPWDGATQRLARLVGKGKAMEMILTGQSVDAAESYRIGLVSRVVSAGKLLPTVMDMAQTVASKASIATGYAREAIRKGLDMTLEQGLSLEADLYFLLQTTEDREEGIRAFLEKRPPQFKGK